MESRDEIWEQLIADWLDAKSARSASEHTRRNYAMAVERWRAFLAARTPPLTLWDADVQAVRQWQKSLRAQGLAESTINHKLSCVSSLYSFVQVKRRAQLSAGGINPFRADSVQRGNAPVYTRARILSRIEVGQLLGWLEQRTGSVAGARNYALLLTFVYTGWHSSELLRMRWGDLRRSRGQAGVTIYAWQGKGNRRADDVLPAQCFNAICAYLRADERLRADIEPALDEAIWLPVCAPRMEHLRHAPSLDMQRPITERSALRVLRSALRGADIPHWQSYRIPDLRHTHAHLLLEGGQPLAVLQKQLHHTSAATTGLYVRAVHGQEPVDMVSDTFALLLG